jgi:prepilin peptidase CpaA
MPNSAIQDLIDARGAPVASTLVGVFLLLATVGMVYDVRSRRIPNNLSLALLVGGVIFWVLVAPSWSSVRNSLTGMAVGFVVWIAFYAIGVMGAGDVKFFAGLSAWLGPGLSWRAALLSAVIGGVLAVIFLLRDRGLGRTFRKLALIPFFRSTHVFQVVDMKEDEARRQLPYGVALGLGAIIAFLLPNVVGSG